MLTQHTLTSLIKTRMRGIPSVMAARSVGRNSGPIFAVVVDQRYQIKYVPFYYFLLVRERSALATLIFTLRVCWFASAQL